MSKIFKGRARYNLLQLQKEQDPSTLCEPWEVADYRKMADDELIQGLSELGVDMSVDSFKQSCTTFDSPEEYVSSFSHQMQSALSNKIYLFIFELWRRYAKDQQSLSIFADEIDRLIEQYEQGHVDEQVSHEWLVSLANVLDDSLDEDHKPEDVFKVLNLYLAQDLEEFLYDFIYDRLDEDRDTYASELLDSYYPFVIDKDWFDFLKFRLLWQTDSTEALNNIQALLEDIIEKKQLALCFEILTFLANNGTTKSFCLSYQKVIPLIKTEEEFKQMLLIAAEYYRCLDLEIEEQFIEKLLEQRRDIDPTKKVKLKEFIANIFNQDELLT